MAYELKDMSGSLWPNEKKEKETHPNTTGTVKIEGKEYYISGWTKQTEDGKKWISLSFKPKVSYGGTTAKPFNKVEDEDLPF